MSPVGHLVFKTGEALMQCLVGSTPTSSATPYKLVIYQAGAYSNVNLARDMAG